MKASSEFSKLINECLKPLLNEYSFSGRGNTFLSKKNENWSLINFQRSRKSSANEVIFTVNLGVASSALFSFFSKEIKRPTIEDCHWRQRIGFLLPQNSDIWWTINYDTEITVLCNELKNCLIKYVIPELEKYSHNSNLRDLWLSDRAPGLTDTQRLMNLTVLINEIGPNEILGEVIKKMRLATQNKPIATTVESLIQKLIQKDRKEGKGK